MKSVARKLRNLLFTPMSISVALVHWMVVAYAYFGDQPRPGFGEVASLSQYVSVANILPLVMSYAVSSPLNYLVGAKTVLVLFLTFTFVFATLQWLYVGTLCQLCWDIVSRDHTRANTISGQERSI